METGDANVLVLRSRPIWSSVKKIDFTLD